MHFVSTPAIGSGVMSVIMNYYRYLDRARVQFDFLCFLPSEASYEEEIKRLGGRIFFIPKPGFTYNTLLTLEGFFEEYGLEYTWLHNHEVYFSLPLKYLAAKYGIPNLIIHSHAAKYSDRFCANIRNYFFCLPNSFIKCERIACSKAAGVFLYRQNAILKKPFFILPNTVEKWKYCYQPNIRNIYRQKLHLEDAFVIGHIGRFVPQKNHMFLLKVFEAVHNVYPKSRLMLIGNGPLKEACIAQAKKLKVEKEILFMGEREDVVQLLQAMDLFILPSLYEGLPISCLEAQAAGLPCLISTKTTKEVILGRNVISLDLNNLKDWINACLKICTQITETKAPIKRFPPDLLPDIEEEAKKLCHFYETGECQFKIIQ